MSPSHFDLAVVGGGIVGVQAALLAQMRNPSWSIALLDARRPGVGASALSAGVFLPGGSTPRQRELWRLGEGVRDLWRRRFETLPIQTCNK